jgi:hypothetical protein
LLPGFWIQSGPVTIFNDNQVHSLNHNLSQPQLSASAWLITSVAAGVEFQYFYSSNVALFLR